VLTSAEQVRGSAERAPPRVPQRGDAAAAGATWGWSFPLLMTAAAGIVVVAVADARARTSTPGATLLLYAGLLLAYLPLALRSLAPGATRRERMTLLCGLVVLLSLVKVMTQAAHLTFFDEFGHWRSLIDLQQSGHLFTPNPLMAVSPAYPGLESATSALVGSTGLSLPVAAAILIGAARLVLVGALYLFFEAATGSARMAAAGAVVYVSNPSFVFFDDQFAYESLAMALAALVLYLCLWPARAGATRPGSWGLLALLVAGLVVTHHLTSYALLGFLVLWVVAALVLRRALASVPVALTVLVLGLEALWLATAARPTVDYLLGIFGPVAREVGGVILHQEAPRQLFQAHNGQVQPFWTRSLALAQAASILVALPVGLLQVWRRRRGQALFWVLAAVALAWPASLLLHLTPSAADVANRMSELVFVGVGGVLALGIDVIWPARGFRSLPSVAVAGWLAVVFSGGAILGWAPQLSVPGPYLVGADNRSVDSTSIAAATWSGDALGPHNRFAADRTNRNLLGTYGRQDPVSQDSGTPTARIFLSPTFDQEDLAILREGHVRYLLVDRRLSSGLPLVGVYYESGEPAIPAGQPLPPAWLAKFDSVAGGSRIYDNGAIQIYDLSGLLDARG
jgi:hypothetical protein